MGKLAEMGNELMVVEREFNGVRIQQREDGYWNATEICKANGKQWSGYVRIKGTEDFLEELSSALQICRAELIQTKEGGDSKNQGTWVHKRIAIDLARWCSPKFAVLINGWVDELLTKGRLDLSGENPYAKALAEIRNEQAQNRETMTQLAAGLLEISKAVAELSANRHMPVGPIWTVAGRLFYYRWHETTPKQRKQIKDLAKTLVLQHLGEQVTYQQGDCVFFQHQVGYLDQAIDFVRRKAQRESRDPGLFD